MEKLRAGRLDFFTLQIDSHKRIDIIYPVFGFEHALRVTRRDDFITFAARQCPIKTRETSALISHSLRRVD